MQVVCADGVERAVESAPEKSEVGLDRVGAHVAAHVHAVRVPNDVAAAAEIQVAPGGRVALNQAD